MTNETRYDHRAVDDLLRAAKEHFLKSGYEKASLRKICASAGVTTGALYFSFANKEALFDALGDSALSFDGTQIRIVEEYREELKQMLGG